MGCAESSDTTAPQRHHQQQGITPGPARVAAAPATVAPKKAPAIYGSTAPAPAPAPAAPPPAAAPSASINSSGKPCVFFISGHCRNGTRCRDSHDPSLLTAGGSRRPGTSGRPCQYFLSGYCRAGNSCPDVHFEGGGAPPPPAAVPPPAAAGGRSGGVGGHVNDPSRPICQDFMEGNCRRGNGCLDQHPVGLGGMEGGGGVGPHAAGGTNRSSSNGTTDLSQWRGDTTDLQAILEASRLEEEQRQYVEAQRRSEEARRLAAADAASRDVNYPVAPPPRAGSSSTAPPPPLQDQQQRTAGGASTGRINSNGSAAPSCHPSGRTLSQVMLEDPMAVYPVFPYHVTDTDRAKAPEDPSLSCPICICPYEEGDKMMLLPCMHRFHAECVADWIKKHPSCPNCNTDVRRTGSTLFTT